MIAESQYPNLIATSYQLRMTLPSLARNEVLHSFIPYSQIWRTKNHLRVHRCAHMHVVVEALLLAVLQGVLQSQSARTRYAVATAYGTLSSPDTFCGAPCRELSLALRHLFKRFPVVRHNLSCLSASASQTSNSLSAAIEAQQPCNGHASTNVEKEGIIVKQPSAQFRQSTRNK